MRNFIKFFTEMYIRTLSLTQSRSTINWKGELSLLRRRYSLASLQSLARRDTVRYCSPNPNSLPPLRKFTLSLFRSFPRLWGGKLARFSGEGGGEKEDRQLAGLGRIPRYLFIPLNIRLLDDIYLPLLAIFGEGTSTR